MHSKHLDKIAKLTKFTMYSFGFKLLWCLHFCFAVFFFFLPTFVDFFTVNSAPMHCSRTHKFHFSTIFSLKVDLTALFIHLKIILLQYFQFLVFSFSKISSIQTDPISEFSNQYPKNNFYSKEGKVKTI